MSFYESPLAPAAIPALAIVSISCGLPPVTPSSDLVVEVSV
ncbi:MAG: hypothetical protein CM15mP107_4090 [Bacteroidota bacterium]|nr:MAG: hypothetical protein CM15mP107_4090 [Bacteroidota bacterium]